MLSLENLHSLSDGAVRQEASDRFLLLLQNAPTTKPVFFVDAKAATPPWQDERLSLLVDRLSTVLVACAIARAEDRQFHRTVRRDYAGGNQTNSALFAVRIGDITDGTSNTLMVAERCAGQTGTFPLGSNMDSDAVL